MKRYLKYIFLSLVSAVLAVSCLEELEPTPSMAQTDDITVLVPRVKSFTNQYVTKAGYSDEEDVITSLKVLVFNNDGALVHTQDMPADTRSLTLNKSMLNTPDHKGKLSNATVVMLANIDLSLLKKADGTPVQSSLTSLTLDDLANSTYYPEKNIILSSELGTGFKGFPMIGGVSVDLTPTSATAQQDPVVIDLKILFAKIEFEINVEQGSENQGEDMQFTLASWAINNVSQATTLAVPTNKGEAVRDFMGNIPDEENVATADEATASSEYTTTAKSGSLPETKTTTLNGTPLKFTFYMAESRYNPGTYTYPINDLHESFKQQFKPEVATTQGGSPAVGMASYVQINGAYIDYRGTSWNVNYNIYLGKNSYDNFHVDRNSHYKNVISIKGIRDRQQGAYSEGAGDVWIDHRVNVAYNGTGADDHVTITRETLIDSHIEVRPLRVKWTGDEYDGVRVYFPTESDGSLVDWIGIERFTGNNNADGSIYCLIDDAENPGKKKSSGKRKYFTTDLISELQNKQGEFGFKLDGDKKYIYLLNGDCAWIYFDENVGSTDRPAEINLEFYTKTGDTKSVVYKVKQRCLQNVGGYNIESYEEYLHSYDSADKYDLSTSPVDYTQQGLEWGFMDHKLSQSILVSSTSTSLKDDMIKRYSYDYFHKSDGANYQLSTKKSGSWADASFGTGLVFTDRASANRDIAVKDMGTKPENAYQYCLSKNKFTTDGLGNVSMEINWYLPDVYEMQAILAASQSGNSTADINSDAFYWSSQPSYDTELLIYINEDIANARAVSAQGVTDLSRNSQNRIRCVYVKDGKPLDEKDMEDRVPDGIDGNFSVYMKAWDNGSAGYFNYLLPAAEEDIRYGKWKYNDDEVEYPNRANSYNNSNAEFKYIVTEDANENPIEGFEGDPQANWTEYELPVIGKTGFYTTLGTYPGLTENTREKIGRDLLPDWAIQLIPNLENLLITEAYRPTSTPKSGEKTDTTIWCKKMDKKLPSANDLRTFDHLRGGNMINISFDQSKGTTLPAFVYDELVDGTTTTNTRTWIRPTYSFVNHPMKSEEKTISAKGSASSNGTSEGTRYGGSIDKARKNAFDGSLSNGWNGAYEKAKKDALSKLKNEITQNYSVWEFNESDVKYTTLTYKSTSEKLDDGTIAVQYSNESESKYLTCESTCKVTLYATVTIKKTAELKLFHQDANTGMWKEDSGQPKDLSKSINTDELRMYCGNSFTISLSDAAKAEGYEITKVKVHYSGNNHVGTSGGASIFGGNYGGDEVYARFVDNTINLASYKLLNQPIVGSTEVLQLPGMDYSADGENGWHQWSGESNTSVTLLLADYNVNYNGTSISYSYLYDNSPSFPTEFIIVDQIEVKCSKKKKAEFDFIEIYKESGNLETSYCAVKHITFTGEAASDEAPAPRATADGLKLYSGSKVTFKAFDDYVINSISGDESLSFKGSQQTVEFTGLPDKTISSKIVVLYSKAPTETD